MNRYATNPSQLANCGSCAGNPIPSFFSNYGELGSFWTTTKGTVLGLGAGILVGIVANNFKDDMPNPILQMVVSPVSASITTLVIYGLVS
jgi:hypothetical protein